MQAYQLVLEYSLKNQKNDEALCKKFADSVVIHADEVADMYFEGDKDNFDLLKDFPNLAPPFNEFILQYRLPIRVTVGGETREYPELKHKYTVVFAGYAQHDEGWGAVFKFVIVDMVGKVVRPFEGNMILMVDKAGQVVLNGKGHASEQWVKADKGIAEVMAQSQIDMYLHPAFLAISLMHCKNISATQKPLPTIAIQKNWQKSNRPFLREYTLNIHPMRTILEQEGGMSTSGIKRALHICRGHFATYTEDKPLFGKFTGTFWKPMHARGSADQGSVSKDYKVHKE